MYKIKTTKKTYRTKSKELAEKLYKKEGIELSFKKD